MLVKISHVFKVLAFMFSIGFGTIAVNAQSRSELMPKERIKDNKILVIKQYVHRFVGDKVDPKGYLSVVTKYDKKGNPVEVENYKQNGKLSSKLTYKYDSDDRKIEYQQFQYLPSGKFGLSYKQVFSYNKDGQKITELGFDGKSSYRVVYTYLSNGNQKEIIKYNSANQVEEKWVFDNQREGVKINIYKPVDKLSRSIYREFDSENNIVQEINFNANGSELGKTDTEYDKGGKVEVKTEFFKANMQAKYDYTYDPKGLLVEVYKTDSDGKKVLFNSFKYDSNGNLLEERWYEDGVNDYSKREFKLDSKGNVNEVSAFYSDYNYRVVYKYEYEFY